MLAHKVVTDTPVPRSNAVRAETLHTYLHHDTARVLLLGLCVEHLALCA